jgi:TolB protein
MIHLLSILMLVVGLTSPPSVCAVVTGSIFGPGSEAFPIAVLPLENLGGDQGGRLGSEFARILSRDLRLSGYFRLLDPATFVERSESHGFAAAEPDFVAWAALGASEVVKGTVLVAGDQITVEVRMYDVAGRRDVPEVGRRFTGPRTDLARMAHRTADRILQVLTGERGPFDSRIALTSTRGGGLKELFTYTFDQEVPVAVTSLRGIVVGPRWHPDRRSILFASYQQHQPRLFQIELASRDVRPLTSQGVFLSGAWSPDGLQLLVTREVGGNTDIYLYDAGGRELRRLTDHWAIDVSPAWAPDGRRFAFCSARTGAPQIYVMDIAGGEARRVSRTGNYNTSPVWSPKGDMLAWVTRGSGGFQVVVQPIDGEARTITRQGSNEDPSWSPDGRYLVFSSTQSGRRLLWMADREGRTQHQLTSGAGGDSSPAWSAWLE